ncbi:MAG: hypothetical protein GF411_17850 [Candidatus Lokiarchaeota archaeon]|nr:hypothetical protein [Candidatus Lokiarchaeota archaeon]
MSGTWLSIAKADFYVLTVKFRKHRYLITGSLFALGIIWATLVAPFLINGILTSIIPLIELRSLLIGIFPGLMRSVIMFLWLALMLFPLAQSLEEIKIGHWEIFLSNNTRTRDILVGGFFGWTPLYGFVALILAPLLLSPFLMAFEVSVVGSILIYCTIFLNVFGVLWLSKYITSLIQSRLGDSSRGNDLAKAMSMIMGIIAIVPMYLIMYAAPLVSDILGLEIFLFLPFTWSADTISWLAISYNGIGLTLPQIELFRSVLYLDFMVSATLMIGFLALITIIGIVSADRIFTISAGVRTEVVSTTGEENIFLRGVRSILKGHFGTLVVINMKDYFRKAQNLSKMFYGLALAIILPVFMTLFTDNNLAETPLELIGIFGIMFALIGAFPHAGVGFLESKKQLWILQGTPSGASDYVKARTLSAFLTDFVLTSIAVIVITLVTGLDIWVAMTLFGIGYLIAVGATMVAIGVTANNPDYDDTKSPAHQTNVMTSIMVPMFAIMSSIIALIVLSILDLDILLEQILGPTGFGWLFALWGPMILIIAGIGFLWSGMRSISRPDE